MSLAHAYVATSATGPLIPGTVERRPVGPNDVLIDIAWAGICHSDIHTVRGDWGDVPYPLVVGHEIAGIVTQVGSQVTRHKVGDRVGVGCMVDSCRECDNCRAGVEQYCLNGFTDTYNGIDRDSTLTQGGYSTHIVVDEHFVLRIPEAIPFEKAAPLLCAGITTYSPLRRWQAGPGKKVAIIGMGGLGHMAVQLAHALGADVTVLSRSLSKKDDGLRLGADHYRATSDPATFEDLANTFDIILNTVGAPPEPVPVTLFTLFENQRSFAGSKIGGIAETQEMLDFCAEHGVTPDIEIVDADQIDDAWERVLAADVRYRFVIDTSTFTS